MADPISTISDVSLCLLVLGLLSPDAALFWYRGNRTRLKAFYIYGVIFVVFTRLLAARAETGTKGQWIRKDRREIRPPTVPDSLSTLV